MMPWRVCGYVSGALRPSLSGMLMCDRGASDAIQYLKSLADTSYAREYVEKAPAQIVTPVRTEVARVLRWGGDLTM